MREGAVVCDDGEGCPSYVMVELFHRIHDREEFTVRGAQIALCCGAGSAGVRHHVVLAIRVQLLQDGAHCHLGKVGVYGVGAVRVRVCK
jgi:hypothetical protein